jgi:hypothetical protein
MYDHPDDNASQSGGDGDGEDEDAGYDGCG